MVVHAPQLLSSPLGSVVYLFMLCIYVYIYINKYIDVYEHIYLCAPELGGEAFWIYFQCSKSLTHQ